MYDYWFQKCKLDNVLIICLQNHDAESLGTVLITFFKSRSYAYDVNNQELYT